MLRWGCQGKSNGFPNFDFPWGKIKPLISFVFSGQVAHQGVDIDRRPFGLRFSRLWDTMDFDVSTELWVFYTDHVIVLGSLRCDPDNEYVTFRMPIIGMVRGIQSH
jgi:hypothetical protein